MSTMHVRGCICEACLNPGSTDAPDKSGDWVIEIGKPERLLVSKSEQNARAYLKRKLRNL